MPKLDPLIQQLVKERASQKSEAKAAPPTPNHQQWSKLSGEPVYLLRLEIKVGTQALKLESFHLGIKANVIELLAEKARGGYRAKISQRLEDAANKLRARQKIIYRRYTVLSEPFRLVHESALAQVMTEIAAMQQEADQLREEVLAGYEADVEDFLNWVESVLQEAALEEPEIETALIQYAAAYPPKDYFEENSLRILVEGPLKVPSLLEDAQREAAELEHAAEARMAEIEREKLRILRRSQETLQQTLLSTLVDAQERSRDEAYGKLAELLQDFTTSGSGATQKQGQKWQTLTDRLTVLAEYDLNLKPILVYVEQIQRLCLSDKPDAEAMQMLMDEFRLQIKQRLEADSATGLGAFSLTKALAFDADYTELLKQLDAITQSPDPDQLLALRGQLAAMEGLFKFRQKDLQKRWQAAESAVNKLLGKGLLLQPGAAVDGGPGLVENEQPVQIEEYDPVAGF